MMKKSVLFLFLLATLAGACKKKEIAEPEPEFVPTDVLVKTNPDFTVEQLFAFINDVALEVEYAYSMPYVSSFPADSLDHVLSTLREKPYLDGGSGYVHAITGELMVFPRFIDIVNTQNQTDWLSTKADLKLSEDTDNATAGYVIFFHVPEGKEKTWVKRFQQYPFVEWATLNHILQIELF